jgi:hypothetical protein
MIITDKKIGWYYNLRKSFKLKKWLKKQLRLFNRLKYFYIGFLIGLVIITAIYEIKINSLKTKIKKQSIIMNNLDRNFNDLELAFKKVTEQKDIDIEIINAKVNNLHHFIKKIYPGYDYKNKIDSALYKNESIENIPESLLPILVDKKYIEPHGVKNYELTLKNLIWPMDKETSFVATKKSEYAQYRPYKLYGYRHEGQDINNFYSDNVYAVYGRVKNFGFL